MRFSLQNAVTRPGPSAISSLPDLKPTPCQQDYSTSQSSNEECEDGVDYDDDEEPEIACLLEDSDEESEKNVLKPTPLNVKVSQIPKSCLA